MKIITRHKLRYSSITNNKCKARIQKILLQNQAGINIRMRSIDLKIIKAFINLKL